MEVDYAFRGTCIDGPRSPSDPVGQKVYVARLWMMLPAWYMPDASTTVGMLIPHLCMVNVSVHQVA